MADDTGSTNRATPEQLAALATQGFFVQRNLFSQDEIAALEAIADQAVDFYNRSLASNESISKKDRIAFVNSGTDSSPVAERLLAFSTQPRIARLARAIAGPRAAHFAYQLVYKYPHNPDPFPWHQDDSYTASSTGYFTIWLAITDATEANGCLRVLPGKSLDALLPYEMTDLGRTCWPLDDPDQGVPVPIARGDAVVFTSKMVHASGGNRTDAFRKSLIMAFMDADAVSTRSGEKFHTMAYPT